jgi:hypothetical protein
MIPDFPREKEKLMRFWIKYLSIKNKELLGIFGTLPAHMNHEGHQWTINRSDGSEDNQPYHEIQGLFSIEISEVPNLTPDKIRQKLDKIAGEMARQMSQNMFSEISRVTRQVGNEVNTQGQPLTKELFLQMVEKIDIDFDEQGHWIPPAIVIHPDLWEAKKDEFKSWESDPEFQLKHEKLIAQKKEEWRDRENRRKLVD